MRFGVCGGQERFSAIVAGGADYLEPSVASYAAPEGPEDVWAHNLAVLRDCGLTAEAWNCFLPGDLKIAGPDADWQRFTRYVQRAIPRVAAAGGRVIVFGSGGSRSAPKGYEIAHALDDFAEAVFFAAGIAAAAGITIAVEPLQKRETNILNSVGETAGFLRAINISNAKCTTDLYHMEAEAEPNTVLRAMGPLIGHAHLADTNREAPGSGKARIAGFLSELRRATYDGRVSIECNWHDFDAQVGPALDFLRRTWATISTTRTQEIQI
jgi:sugar phosphate isomerase/epimerase